MDSSRAQSEHAADPGVAAEPPAVADDVVSRLRFDLERAERLATVGALAGAIAHEVNNILTPVRTYAQMALSRPGDAALARKALAKAEEGSRRAAEITRSLLAFARGGEGSAGTDVPRGTSRPPTPSTVPPRDRAEVGAALDGALGLLTRDLAKDGIELRRKIEEGGGEGGGEGCVAAISPIALEHVLLNLILNARRAMVEGGGGSLPFAPPTSRPRVLMVRAERRDGSPGSGGSSTWNIGAGSGLRVPGSGGEGGCSTWNIGGVAGGRGERWVAIDVVDTGCGIEAARLERVFEPFQAGASGTGMGMSVCRRLVEEAGGMIEVESEVGRGTVVRVILPGAAQE